MARPRRIRRTGAILVAVLAAMTLAVPAAAGAQVTRGTFHAFSVNTTLDISGHAVMVRTADGRTFVSVHLEGLAANTAYGSHVHRQACSVGLAGTHYRFNPTGPADDVNEIWPGFTTNGAGIGNGNARNDGTAGTTAVSVVVHAPSGLKIACADLG